MSPLTIAWIASLAGAAIFFGLGFVVRALRSGPPPASRHPDQGTGDAETARRLELELRRVTGEREELASELANRARALDGLALERDELGAELGEVRRRLTEAMASVGAPPVSGGSPARAEGVGRGAEAEQARADLARQDKAVAALKERLAEAEAAGEVARKAAARGDKARLAAQAELATLRSEHNQLVRTCQRLEEQAADRRAELSELSELRAEAERLRAELDASATRVAPPELATHALEAADQDAAAAEVRRLEKEARRTQTEASELRRTVASLTQRLASAEGAADQLAAVRAEAELLREEAQQLRHERQIAQTRQEELELLREEARELREQLAGLEGLRGAEAEAELLREEAQQLRHERQVAQTRQEELERLREEAGELRGQLAGLEGLRGAEAEAERLRAELHSLQVERELVSRKLEGMQEAEEGRVALAAQVEALSRRAEEAETLRQRVHRLEAQMFGAGLAPVEEPAVRPVRAAAAGESLDRVSRLLGELDCGPGVRAAAVADAMGLLVAGKGEALYFESMAALAGPAFNLAQRVTELLPMTSPRLVQVADAQKVVLTLRLFGSDESFALTTLSAAAPPSDETLDRCVAALGEALGV